MLSLIPDLAPRDSHSLWYTSSRSPHDNHPNHYHNGSTHDNPPTSHAANHRRGAHVIERSPLARLRADEHNLDRRRQNVTNFGSTWLKPPGIPKTLHQLREERREAEEHQEALRREQLAQELAEAEAAGPGGVGGGGEMLADVPEDAGAMDDVQLDGTQDLDQDIPEGDADFGLEDDDEEEDEEEEEEEEEEEDEGAGDDGLERTDGDLRAAREQEHLMAQRMREADSLRAGHTGARDFYGAEEAVDDEDQAQMIEEDELAGEGDELDLGMDADLDDDIPEAESAQYEHTDTEADLSSDDDNHGADVSIAAAATRAPQRARFRTSLARSDVTQNSMAISDLLSRDGSSFMGSSPHVPGSSVGPSRRPH